MNLSPFMFGVVTADPIERHAIPNCRNPGHAVRESTGQCRNAFADQWLAARGGEADMQIAIILMTDIGHDASDHDMRMRGVADRERIQRHNPVWALRVEQRRE